ncbi:uncharacterized protein LOC115147703 isoform X5 [Salmo trutta]|uniref:uncharacterized protein LOC115147703 isoform X5 n=1 Tax=Salmo trutta TaxID=8032 RepID=UPI001130A8E8|nr:uncharacterized protein LOC115147703 isoform X5 [Salmo trutta]
MEIWLCGNPNPKKIHLPHGPTMAEPKLMESSGSGCGLPAQRSSQRDPEMVSVKLEDCSQPLEVNVIMIGEEREVKEEEQVVEEKRAVKEEKKERGVEEVENREVSAPDLEEEEEEVDSITDPGEISNPGSDSEPSSTASGNNKQHRQRNSRQKHHHCMACFTRVYEPQDLKTYL